MCGIAGFIAKDGITGGELTALDKMVGALKHRGPDAFGHWINPKKNTVLGHTRLSILDLSENGAQPMTSACGRYTLSFNGEIYNDEEIRAKIDYPYKGHSDTEVMLAAFTAYGIEKSLVWRTFD